MSKVTTQNLVRGGSKGCTVCSSLPKGESAFNDLIGRYRRSARSRGYVWLLTDVETRTLFNSICFYCKRLPTGIWAVKLKGGFQYNGIDRKDNFLGYTPDNCVPCCATCNYMKGDLSYEQFIQHVRRIVEAR